MSDSASVGDLARRTGDYARALKLRQESLRLAWEVESKVEAGYALEQLALIASAPLSYGWAALTGVAAAAGAQAFRSQRGVGLFAGATALTVAVGWLAGGIR